MREASTFTKQQREAALHQYETAPKAEIIDLILTAREVEGPLTKLEGDLKSAQQIIVDAGQQVENLKADAAALRRAALDAVSVAIAALVAEDPTQFISNSPDLQRAKATLESNTAGRDLLELLTLATQALEAVVFPMTVHQVAAQNKVEIPQWRNPIDAVRELASHVVARIKRTGFIHTNNTGITHLSDGSEVQL